MNLSNGSCTIDITGANNDQTTNVYSLIVGPPDYIKNLTTYLARNLTMFAKKIPIIFLTKDRLQVALVKLGKEPKIISSDETAWSKDSLSESFKQAKKQLKTKSIRILLADDLAYVLSLNIPFDTKPKVERQLIEDKIKPEIPEILDHQDWDFKETGRKTQLDKQIIAFAPVKSTFTLISQALIEANLNLEAIEPEVISKITHSDPIIGLALKKDIKGRDEKTLNLSSLKVFSKAKAETQAPEIPPPPLLDKLITETNLEPATKITTIPKQKFNKNIIYITLSIAIVVALIAGGIVTSQNALKNKPAPFATPLVIATPVPISSPSATHIPASSPSPLPQLILSDYNLLVLNGTGGKGVAGTVKDILEVEGFENIKADNADKFDFTLTQVQLKQGVPVELFNTIDRALNSDYEVTISAELLTTSSEYDVIIIVGQTTTGD